MKAKSKLEVGNSDIRFVIWDESPVAGLPDIYHCITITKCQDNFKLGHAQISNKNAFLKMSNKK